ncbi:MAG: DNA utilization protein GntX [candidate division WS6 bacterium OLB20]|uniref:DNA utilization protein GntX n=1 Tax=candidate division WS6 bacterium OLB20 TaxID=1617426 RepID=A0A136LZ00_9BACT|nr:MAG: DNA utilization protein GntX [candidate division WS6 bacterium OLB20]
MLAYLLDILFPQACALCSSQGSNLCQACRRKLPRAELPEDLYDTVCAAVGYGPGVQRYVHQIKFGLYHTLCAEMAQMMHLALDDRGWQYDLLVPVPLSAKRLKWRGFNQAGVIARQIDAARYREALVRNRHTPPQAELDAAARSVNLTGAFAVNRDVRGMDIIVVDDVYTTGATARECCDTLIAAGCRSCRVLVWAYTAAA